MSVCIRLARFGRLHRPFFRVVAIDKRNAREGLTNEVIGTYDPLLKEKNLVVEMDRVTAWVNQGAVISEFPMALKPHPSNFPRRNRIIAGLTSATVLIEGGPTSGSLITARIAAEEGRDVFAVPGPATSPLSRAPHLLLKQGAMFAESGADVMAELGWIFDVGLEKDGGGVSADPILAALSDDPLTREDLLVRTGLEAAAAAARLVDLEIRGLVRSLPGGKLVRA